MEYGLGPTIVSLIFLIILTMIYNSKEKIESLENRVFSYLLKIGLILTSVTIAYAVCLNNFDILWLNIVFWKSYVFFLIAFCEVLTLYLIILIENYRNKTFKELWENKHYLAKRWKLFKTVVFSSPRMFCISCFCSISKLCLTLCDPMNCSTPGFPVLHYLPEFTQIHTH